MFGKLRKGSVVAPAIEGEREHIPEVDSRPPLDAVPKTYWGKRIPVIACGSGLFADGYLNSAIGPVNTLLKKRYGKEYTGNNAAQNVSSIAFVGEVVGIIIFGYTSDHYSRKWSLVAATIILFVFAALAAGSYGAGGSVSGLIAALTAYRFLIGIGLGGEYPAGSVACAESTGEVEAGSRNRWFILFTNCAIDVGFVVSYIVATIVVYICGDANLSTSWRVILGIGAIPPLTLLWMRYKLKEPEAFEREKMTKAKTPWKLVFKMYWFRLMVVSAIWFIYDFSSYAFSIYSSTIVGNIVGDGQPLYITFAWSILINAFYLPGAYLGSWVSDRLGPRYTLAGGVAAQAIVGFIMAGCYGPLSEYKNIVGFCIVYGIFLSMGELGPGDNIGLVASKTCATPIRGQYYAIAAAAGKIGAFIGTWVFPVIQADAGSDVVKQGQFPFWVASPLALLSAALALFCLPHIGQDTIDEEDRRFRAYLLSHGYDTSKMGVANFDVPSDDSIGSNVEKHEAVPDKLA